MEQTPIQNPILNSVPPVIPPVPPAPLTPPTSWIASPKKKGGMVSRVIGLVVVLVIIGAGIALASRIWDPAWSPFRPKPQVVFDTAFNKMKDWKTSTTNAILNLRVKDDVQKFDISILANGNGKADVTDENNPRSSSTFNISGDIGVVGSIYKINIGLEQVQVNSNLTYLNLKTIELPQEFLFLLPMVGIDISKIQNQWIKIDAQEIQQLAGATNDTATIGTDQQKQLTEKITQILLNAKLNKIKEQLSNESIDNQNMYHYLVAIDRDELKKGIKDFVNTFVSTLGNLPDTSSMDSQLDSALSAIGDIDYQVWIGQQDGELHKIKFAKSIDISKISPDQKGMAEIGFETSYSEINKPVVITEPATSKTLQEVFPFLEQMITAQKDQALMTEMTILNNIADSVISSDGNLSNFKCSDPRIKLYCDNIKNIIAQDPVIYQSNNKYCGYVKTLSSNKYICITLKGSIPSIGSYTNNPENTCTKTKFACPSK